MHSALGFSGRMGRGPYAILTLGFAALVLALAIPSGAPFAHLLTAPWAVLGHAMDGVVRIGEDGRSTADLVVSAAIIVLFLWVFSAITVRRLRDIGQSPWWTVLVMFSGFLVPAMIVLSLVRSTTHVERGRASARKEPVDAALRF